MYCKLWAKENPDNQNSCRGQTPPQWGPLNRESQIRLNPTKVGNTTSRLAHPHRPGSCSSGPRRSVPTFCPQSAHKTPKNHTFQHNLRRLKNRQKPLEQAEHGEITQNQKKSHQWDSNPHCKALETARTSGTRGPAYAVCPHFAHKILNSTIMSAADVRHAHH